MSTTKFCRVAIFASTLTTLCLLGWSGRGNAKTFWFGQSNQDQPQIKQTNAGQSGVRIDFGAKSKTNPNSWVRGTVEVQASPELVWYSVHETRKKDPDLAYTKVIERTTNEETYEEKFVQIPILGTATCVLRDKEVPLRRIDYELVTSDHFKAMDGSWVFLASADGKSTTLELTSHLDTGLPVPQSFVDGNLAKKIERRLNHVKAFAESMCPTSTSMAPQAHVKVD
jgi:hypothetical protein